MFKRIVLLTFFVVFVMALIGAYDPHYPTKEKMLFSAKRGAGWLLQYPGQHKDPGVLWILKEINDTYCHLPSIDSFINARWESEFSSLPIEQAYKKLLDPMYKYHINEDLLSKKGQPFDSLLLPALYCNSQPISNTKKGEILSVQSSSGYELTHKFLAMIFLKKNSCASPEELAPSIDVAVKNIIKEENSSYFNDLYAERISLLEYGGFGNIIQDKWLENVIAHQSSDGSWGNLEIFGNPKDPHTTALAVWALSQNVQVCTLR